VGTKFAPVRSAVTVIAVVVALAGAGALFWMASTRDTVWVSDEYLTWTRDVPESMGTFMDLPIQAVFEVSTSSADGPRDREQALLDEILADLPSTMRKAEATLATYERDTGNDYSAHVKYPHIWIREDRERPKEWTLVVERDDWPGYGWHIEFDGSNLVEIWAGD
jgi:hypothetical protein